jgi:hypothetical protein
MLIIAIGHGNNGTDPFTCSVVDPDIADTPERKGFSPSDAVACLQFICRKQKLDPHHVDELLVVYADDYGVEPSVQHYYTAGNDWNFEEEECPVCKKWEGEAEHPPGMFPVRGGGLRPCPWCDGSTKVKTNRIKAV